MDGKNTGFVNRTVFCYRFCILQKLQALKSPASDANHHGALGITHSALSLVRCSLQGKY